MQEDITHERFLLEAEQGNWPWINEHLTDNRISREMLMWAVTAGRRAENNDIRDLAATYLNTSSLALGPSVMRDIKAWMLEDKYPIVQYRLAIALYRRGDTNPAVAEMYSFALADPDVGPDAEKYGKVAA